MTDQRVVKDLIGRLEKATGPDKELDAELFEITSGASAYRITPAYKEGAAAIRRRISDLPEYTRSVSTALELLGDRWFCLSGPHNANGGKYRKGAKTYEAVTENTAHDATGATPAIAICIVFLRALGDA